MDELVEDQLHQEQLEGLGEMDPAIVAGEMRRVRVRLATEPSCVSSGRPTSTSVSPASTSPVAITRAMALQGEAVQRLLEQQTAGASAEDAAVEDMVAQLRSVETLEVESRGQIEALQSEVQRVRCASSRRDAAEEAPSTQHDETRVQQLEAKLKKAQQQMLQGITINERHAARLEASLLEANKELSAAASREASIQLVVDQHQATISELGSTQQQAAAQQEEMKQTLEEKDIRIAELLASCEESAKWEWEADRLRGELISLDL